MDFLWARAALHPMSIWAAVLTVVAILVFFLIFCFIERKARIKRERIERERREKELAERSLRPRSALTVEGNIKEDKLLERDDYKPFRHWGNLTLSERVATLAIGDKVLYAAVKKELAISGLQNFSTDICEIYFSGERPAARLIINRGQIYLFTANNPRLLDKAVFNHEDVSDEEGYEMLPTMVVIRNSAQVDVIPDLLKALV